jgi:hypothetical protein
LDEVVAWAGAPAEAPAGRAVEGPGSRLGRIGRREAVAIRAAFARAGLPAWFVVIDLLWLAKADTLGIDARHYQAAASAWLAGQDPWQVRIDWIPFAAGPHTLLFYAPTSVLPAQLSEAFWMTAGILATIWTVRRLDLPGWWLAFPPLFHAAWNGNPHAVALALLVSGWPVAAALAAGLKYYGLLPLLARPRQLAFALVVLIVTLPFLPWQLYLGDGLGLSLHLATAWNGSATRVPILIPVVVASLWIIRRQGAEWLIVPALWPGTQFYYQSLGLPAARNRPWLAAALALPAPLLAPAAVIAMAVLELWRRRRPQPAEGPLVTRTAGSQQAG